MVNDDQDRISLLQGTLDMLVLQTLLQGPTHGHAIATHIQRMSDEVLQVDHGSLYPALRRLEKNGWITSKWELSKELNREVKRYRLTPSGRKQLVTEESKWNVLAKAIAKVMKPAR